MTDAKHKNTNQVFQIAWTELASINQFTRRSSPMDYDKNIYLIGAAHSDDGHSIFNLQCKINLGLI